MSRRLREQDTAPLPKGFEPVGAPLGAGSSAVVWPARRTLDGRIFAVKVWRGRFHDADERRTFLEEVRRHAGLSRESGHLVSYAWAEVDAARPWIALEPRGSSLELHLRHGVPEPASGLVWSVDLLAGLAVLHSAGLLHRDVKPANVLVDQGRAAICDFGLVVQAEAVTDDDAAGTPRWTAPELLHDGQRPTMRSDVYSAAVVVRELVGENPPAEIEQLVTAASSVRPSDRPATAGEFAARLRAAAESAGVRLPPELRGRRPDSGIDGRASRRPWSRRRRALTGAAASVALLAALGTSQTPTAALAPEPPRFAPTALADVLPDGTVVDDPSGLEGFCQDHLEDEQLVLAQEVRTQRDVLVGSVEVFWSASESRACARLLKPLAWNEPGFPTPMVLTLCGSEGGCDRDGGTYTRYAGPVLVPSLTDCLAWRGSIADQDGRWQVLEEEGVAGCAPAV